MAQRVMSVDSASIFLLKSFPPYVGVAAHGKVPTSGWSRPSLEPWLYFVAPDDGIQDFDFIAEPPAGISFPVVLPIAAVTVIPRDPRNYWGEGKPLIGVRIHARENTLEAKLDERKELQIQANMGAITQSAPYPWPWPWSPDHIAAGGLPLPWPFPWSVARPAGPEPWPWSVARGPQPWPWPGFVAQPAGPQPWPWPM
jgi:hypothetical protein